MKFFFVKRKDNTNIVFFILYFNTSPLEEIFKGTFVLRNDSSRLHTHSDDSCKKKKQKGTTRHILTVVMINITLFFLFFIF